MFNHYKNNYRKSASKKRGSLEIMGYKELVKKLDRCFSEYIRLSAADDSGLVRCITCGKIMFWREADNGHYIGRKHMATGYDEMNCRCQCIHCNHYLEGNHFIFRQKLVDIYGEELIQRMEIMTQVTGSENSESLRYKIVEYQEKVKRLRIEKGL